MSKFIYFYFIIIIFLIFIANICSSQNIELENSLFSNKEFISQEFHYTKNSEYSWPLFGYYSISSYFGKRISPTSRSI